MRAVIPRANTGSRVFAGDLDEQRHASPPVSDLNQRRTPSPGSSGVRALPQWAYTGGRVLRRPHPLP
jgi:hypothetical protein